MESKPRILCLHGGGTSAMIFRFQTIRLRRELDSTFDFVFLDAPFLSKAGPGVLPVFEDCGPYYSWIVPGTPEGKPVPNESIQLIQKAMDDQVASTGKPFVGILGFSQGTKIGSGLLLQQQSDREKKQEQKNPLRNADFRFGVFLMGGPPLLPPQYPPFDVLERCATPSVHVVGLEDPLLDFGRVLCSDFFEMDKVKYMELAGVGHHLPDGQSQPLTAQIARAILDVWAVV